MIKKLTYNQKYYAKKKAEKEAKLEKARENYRKYYQTNRKTLLKKHAEWVDANRDWVNEYNRKYRAKAKKLASISR